MLSEWIVKTYFKSTPKEHFETSADGTDGPGGADDVDGTGGADGTGDADDAGGADDADGADNGQSADRNGINDSDVTADATTHTTSGDDIKDAFDEIENLFIFKIDTFIGENSPFITQTNNLNKKLQAYVDTLKKIEDVKSQMLNNINAIRTYKLTLNRLKTEEVTDISYTNTEGFTDKSLGDVKKDFETRIKMIKNQQYQFECLITKLSFLNSGIKKIMTLFQGDITVKGLLDNVINFHDENFKLDCMDSSIKIQCIDSVPTLKNEDSSDFNKSTLNNEMFNEMCNTINDDNDKMDDTIYNEILSLKGVNNKWNEDPHNTNSKLLKDSDGNILTRNHVYSSQQCGKHVHNVYLDSYMKHMNNVLDKITATLPQAGLSKD